MSIDPPDVWDALARPGPDAVEVAGTKVRVGSRVLLHPRPGGEVWDSALDAKTGVVDAIEDDVELGVRLVVSLADDPARDLARFSPGHRFFVTPDEVSPLAQRRVLVAGVGNIFWGDDAFGTEVVRRLQGVDLGDGVDVRDYGIRGMDLAYAMRDYDDVVIVDAIPAEGPPGTLHVLEPGDVGGDAEIETHAMDPVRVIRLARELFEDLSGPVAAAVDPAVALVRRLVGELCEEGGEPA
jgi:hydrogenase maturation protease